MHGMTGELEAAIGGLYSTFARYPLRSLTPSLHGFTTEEVRRIERRLRTLPLNRLGLDEIGRFYTDGVLTWGGIDDFRHLLPRLMELFAAFHLGEPVEWSGDPRDLDLDLDPDLALMRFTDADWETWPDAERDAVCRFMLELWKAWLTVGGDIPLEWGSWFEVDLAEAMLRLVPDPEPFLAAWRTAEWPGVRHLSWFLANNHADSWINWMDEDHPASVINWYRVRNWLDEPETADRLLDAALTSAPREMAWEPVLALDALERGRPGCNIVDGVLVADETLLRRARELGVALPIPAAETREPAD